MTGTLVNLNQGSPEWKAWRRDGIGGSDIATIMGVAPFKDATRENLLREKAEGWERPPNFAMRRGTRLEPVARFAYEQFRECVAPPVCVEMQGATWARVSLDGLCRYRAIPCGVPWVLELKVPGWGAHDLALAGMVPDYYVPQCQWQLLVTGLFRLDYASYSENQRFAERDRLAVVTVWPDEATQSELLEQAVRFWLEVEDRRAKLKAERANAPRPKWMDRAEAAF
jgi:putative phage-type endonuclease